MESNRPQSQIVTPIIAGEEIEVSEPHYSFGSGPLRMRVEEVGPTFIWHGGDRWQEVRGTELTSTGQPRGLIQRVATVRIKEVRRLNPD